MRSLLTKGLIPVTPTTLRDVLAQRAYMLFFVKRSLAYAQPNVKTLHPTINGSNGAIPSAAAIPPTDADEGAPTLNKVSNPYAGRGGHPISGMQI